MPGWRRCHRARVCLPVGNRRVPRLRLATILASLCAGICRRLLSVSSGGRNCAGGGRRCPLMRWLLLWLPLHRLRHRFAAPLPSLRHQANRGRWHLRQSCKMQPPAVRTCRSMTMQNANVHHDFANCFAASVVQPGAPAAGATHGAHWAAKLAIGNGRKNYLDCRASGYPKV